MENCLPFTDDATVVLVHKSVQQTHHSEMCFKTLGYIPHLLTALNGLVYFLIIGEPRGDNLMVGSIFRKLLTEPGIRIEDAECYLVGEMLKIVSMIRKYHNHNRRQPGGTKRKSRSTITRHQEDKLSKANSISLVCSLYLTCVHFLLYDVNVVSLPSVSWLLWGSSSQCHGFIFSLWLWYFLIILIYIFWNDCNIVSSLICGGKNLMNLWTLFFKLIKVN